MSKPAVVKKFEAEKREGESFIGWIMRTQTPPKRKPLTRAEESRILVEGGLLDLDCIGDQMICGRAMLRNTRKKRGNL